MELQIPEQNLWVAPFSFGLHPCIKPTAKYEGDYSRDYRFLEVVLLLLLLSLEDIHFKRRDHNSTTFLSFTFMDTTAICKCSPQSHFFSCGGFSFF